jgi:hypothetical protein
MKDKKIIEMIKTKAQQNDVPNVLNELKEKLNIEVIKAPEMIDEPKRVFNFKALYASLTFVLALSVVVVISLLYQSPSMNLLEDADFSDHVMLSAISTTEVISTNELLSLEENIILVEDLNEDDYVENQIDDILKYSELVETLLVNQEAFEKTLLNSDLDNYKHMMNFSFYDLNNEKITYKLYYNQTIDYENETYILDTKLVTQNEAYDLMIEGELGQEDFIMTYHINAQEKIKTAYQKGNMMNQFIIQRLLLNEVTQESMISYENKQQINLSFTRGEAKGIYEFTLDETIPNQRGMHVRYRIDSIDEGTIEIRINEDDMNNFILEIIPDHRPSTVVEKERPYGPPKRDEPGNPNMPHRGN